jgi:hypothetical protein
LLSASASLRINCGSFSSRRRNEAHAHRRLMSSTRTASPHRQEGATSDKGRWTKPLRGSLMNGLSLRDNASRVPREAVALRHRVERKCLQYRRRHRRGRRHHACRPGVLPTTCCQDGNRPASLPHPPSACSSPRWPHLGSSTDPAASSLVTSAPSTPGSGRPSNLNSNGRVGLEERREIGAGGRGGGRPHHGHGKRSAPSRRGPSFAS